MIAFAIKMTSPGPVFYRGTRTGLGGRPFRIFKFRTMIVDADRIGGASTALNDPRVTRIGHLLRRYKLDELPQLMNVLIGDMSIVGPRPEVPLYTDQYEGEELLILSVRPGITDYASLHFLHQEDILGTTDPDRMFVEKVQPLKTALRLQYIKVHTFWRDLAIIFKTLLRIMGLDVAAMNSLTDKER
jgi:lipopolysaccharide/colanic/teichoic acid biosynthesis glycosyltransferase